MAAGSLVIVSGPSGAGKSALAGCVLQSVPNLKFSVSYTTRAPRGFERNGTEYYFVSHREFQELVQQDALLEWAEVYGNLYGTSRQHVDAVLNQGFDLLLDVDVQGARTIRGKRPDAVTVFILPPSYAVLRQRLGDRNLDKDIVIGQRLRIACAEIKQYGDYDYLIINEDLDRSQQELTSIILASRCRRDVRAERARSIVATFGGWDEGS
jgi:guanylate kinase